MKNTLFELFKKKPGVITGILVLGEVLATTDVPVLLAAPKQTIIVQPSTPITNTSQSNNTIVAKPSSTISLSDLSFDAESILANPSLSINQAHFQNEDHEENLQLIVTLSHMAQIVPIRWSNGIVRNYNTITAGIVVIAANGNQFPEITPIHLEDLKNKAFVSSRMLHEAIVNYLHTEPSPYRPEEIAYFENQQLGWENWLRNSLNKTQSSEHHFAVETGVSFLRDNVAAVFHKHKEFFRNISPTSSNNVSDTDFQESLRAVEKVHEKLQKEKLEIEQTLAYKLQQITDLKNNVIAHET
jgi:hypothetical protein